MKRVDQNHELIVKGLRRVGATILSLAPLGRGAPDIACGFRKQNYFFEIKNPTQPPSKRRLTEHEKEFHEEWRGQVCVIESLDDALKAIGAIP